MNKQSVIHFLGLGLGAIFFLSTVFVSSPLVGLGLVLAGAICIFGSEYLYDQD